MRASTATPDGRRASSEKVTEKVVQTRKKRSTILTNSQVAVERDFMVSATDRAFADDDLRARDVTGRHRIATASSR